MRACLQATVETTGRLPLVSSLLEAQIPQLGAERLLRKEKLKGEEKKNNLWALAEVL